MKDDLLSYYSKRAQEYEAIYQKPERQEDLKVLTQLLQQLFKNKEVLEIGCGTGYWTERIALSATSVLATDINEPVLEIAKSKLYARSNVAFQQEDFNCFSPVKQFESVFGGFIWSHVKLQELDGFIARVNQLVNKGGIVAFADNLYVEGSNLPIAHVDESGNTFQVRTLENGEMYSVLKNFPSRNFIESKLLSKAVSIHYTQLNYYWLVSYHPVL